MVRRSGAEEEQSQDEETNHVPETLGWASFYIR